MPNQRFRLILDRKPTDDELDLLFEAGCDDAGFERGPRGASASFNREAPTLAGAVASAIQDVESTGLRVTGVVERDLWTVDDIADRIGRSREAVRRYTTGERGPGGFPHPFDPEPRDRYVFYRWSEVAPWLREKLGLDVEDPDPTLLVANSILQARKHRDRVANMKALTDLLVA
jgi:hypothetical protein